MMQFARVLVSCLLFVLACNNESSPSSEAPGETRDWAAEARALLEEGRPWRAARVMQEYRASVAELPPEHRLLAARAEAGWEHWEAVGTYLEGAPGLDSLGNGIGLYLLARARDGADDPAGAAGLYRRFLDVSPEEPYARQRSAARLRLGLALIRSGEMAEGEAVLSDVSEAMGPAAMWVDLLKAEAYAKTGRAEAAQQVSRRYDSGLPGLRARRALVEAARAAGDLDRARALVREGYAWANSSTSRAEFKVVEGRLALAQGDVGAGRAALRQAIALNVAGVHGQAAADLLREGRMTPEDHLASARVYAGLGLHDRAAGDFRRWLNSDAGSPSERKDVRLALAASLIAGQMYDEVPGVLKSLGDDRAARDLRASALSRRGRTEQAAEIYRRLASEQRGSAAGAAVLYFAADAYQQGGDAAAARPLYRQVAHSYPGTRWMGLALMRLAGLYFLEGDYREAAAIWDHYRQRYPKGALALQSTYWAGRARAEAGDTDAAEELFRRVRSIDRNSYYALKASERLDEDFWPLPMEPSPPRDAAVERRVAGWLAPIDRLREAGFSAAASAEVERLVGRADADRAVRYALAEALAERGYTKIAIRIGTGLQRGRYNPRLLRILYPYPYREMIEAEARKRGFPSTIAAALVRQESMFKARITSHVGARGLLQIMPATGAELAEANDLEVWNPDYLYQPEISAHLGMGYIAEGLERYNGSLPAVFAAYNAGPHQVDEWRTFPEFKADEELFTERIPFGETRDYVKKLTRNMAIYDGLYGEEGAAGERTQ